MCNDARYGDVISWDEHYQNFCNPELTTALLKNSVPLLNFVNWRVEEVREGYCHSFISTIDKTPNKCTSLQSSTLFLAADYTGGIALYTLLRGIPSFGITPVETGNGVCLWLIRSEFEFNEPATTHLKIFSHVPKNSFCKIKDRFFRKKPVIERLEITFENNGHIASRGFMTYYAQLTDYNEWLTMGNKSNN